MKPPKAAAIEEIAVTLKQEEDCCCPTGELNRLEIKTQDGGGGKYVVIKGRWALDDESDIDELCASIKQVLRFGDDQ
jgi:hypothetical protein